MYTPIKTSSVIGISRYFFRMDITDILKEILSYIQFRDWSKARRVCKRWYNICKEIQDPSLDDNEPLHWSCLHGKLECVRYLLKDPRVNPNMKNFYKICYDSKKDIITRTSCYRLEDEQSWHPIICAVWNGHFDVFKEMLNHKRVDHNMIDYHQCLLIASRHGYKDIVEELLIRIEVDGSWDYIKCLLQACAFKHFEIADKFMELKPIQNSSILNLIFITAYDDLIIYFFKHSKINVLPLLKRICETINQVEHLKYLLYLAIQTQRYDIVEMIQKINPSQNH